MFMVFVYHSGKPHFLGTVLALIFLLFFQPANCIQYEDIIMSIENRMKSKGPSPTAAFVMTVARSPKKKPADENKNNSTLNFKK